MATFPELVTALDKVRQNGGVGLRAATATFVEVMTVNSSDNLVASVKLCKLSRVVTFSVFNKNLDRFTARQDERLTRGQVAKLDALISRYFYPEVAT